MQFPKLRHASFTVARFIDKVASIWPERIKPGAQERLGVLLINMQNIDPALKVTFKRSKTGRPRIAFDMDLAANGPIQRADAEELTSLLAGDTSLNFEPRGIKLAPGNPDVANSYPIYARSNSKGVHVDVRRLVRNFRTKAEAINDLISLVSQPKEKPKAHVQPDAAVLSSDDMALVTAGSARTPKVTARSRRPPGLE